MSTADNLARGQFDRVLAEHARWLASDEEAGQRADLSGLQLDGFDLSGADLSGALLRGTSLNGATLKGVQLTHADLTDASLRGADLTGSNLLLADFSGADLREARLCDTASESSRELGHVQRGPKFCDALLSGAQLQRCFCKQSDFSGSRLGGADLGHANLEGANFSFNDLSGARLEGARLAEADFRGSCLRDADLRRASLTRADFSTADLTCADVSGANLQGANFADALVEGIRYDRKGTFRGVRVSSCYGSSRFRREAQDQDFIEEFREANPLSYRLWLIFTDCGRSMFRVVMWSVGLTILFAAAYFALGEEAFAVSNKSTLGWSFFTTVYYSVVTFTTLGFGDVTPLTRTAAVVVMLEVVVGYVMLGILISILATKVARRS